MYKAKSKSIAVITIAILTLSMVLMAVHIEPVNAALGIELQTQGNGTAEWTTAKQHTGMSSVKLSLPTSRTDADGAMIVIPVGAKLSTFTNDGFGLYFYKPTSWNPLTPYFELEFDLDGDGSTDTWLTNAHTNPDHPENQWVLGKASQENLIWDGSAWIAGTGGWRICTFTSYTITPYGTDENGDNYWDLSEWIAGAYDGKSFGDAVVVNVRVQYGLSTGTGYTNLVYVDDIAIHGVVWPLDCLALSPSKGPIGTKVTVSGVAVQTPSTTYPVRVYWSTDNTLNLGVDTLFASITSPKTAGQKDYETTITVPSVTSAGSYYVIAWQDVDRNGAVSSTEYEYDVFEVTYFSASISPAVVKAGTYEFSITVKNDISTSSINIVEIHYPIAQGISFADAIAPAGWFLEDHWWGVLRFKATGGYEITKGTSKIFKVSLDIPDNADGTQYWNVGCQNTAGLWNWLWPTITVDTVKPSIIIEQPATNDMHYSVGSGNRIWINGTVEDRSPSSGLLSVAINNTKFSLVSFSTTTGAFSFANNTVIPDGKLAVNVTATDKAGNVGSAVVWAIIDNTMPRLLALEVEDDTGLLKEKDGTFYMRKTTTSLQFNVTFYDADEISTKIMYINETVYEIENKTDIPAGGYSVPSDCNLVVVNNITIIDNADPTKNEAVFGPYYVRRDTEAPGVPTFTYEAICGGLVIRSLNATDNVDVASYEIQVNVSSFVTVTATQLASATGVWVDSKAFAFEGVLVLKLTDYAGNVANVTIRAEDYAGNKGNWSTPAQVSIPEGLWHPVTLQAKWNLISLPLIPASTARADILSLLLKQGAAGVKVIYEYDAVAGAWVTNPDTIEDGKGYWVYMKAYDVLIVQGTKTPAPPALPTTYHLYKGWNLAGFTSTEDKAASDYLESLESGSYFRWIYVWDPEDQNWSMIDTKPATSGTLSPGQAFWIYMYSEQDLVPPI